MSDPGLASALPDPPYYAVIFSSRRTAGEQGSARSAGIEPPGASPPRAPTLPGTGRDPRPRIVEKAALRETRPLGGA